MASITISGLKLSLIKDQGNDGKVRLYLNFDGHLSMSDIIIYLVIDGILWLSLFAIIMSYL